jgi:hypothetical protein
MPRIALAVGIATKLCTNSACMQTGPDCKRGEYRLSGVRGVSVALLCGDVMFF